MKRRAALRVLGVAGLASLLGACQVGVPPDKTPTAAPTSAPTPAPTIAPTEVAAIPGIRLAIDQDPDTLDPAGQTNPTASSIVEHLAETLVRRQPDGSIAAGLARKFTQSPDGKTFIFELRPDVEFHDGSLLDAEAAAMSLNRFLDPRLRVPCGRRSTPTWSPASPRSTRSPCASRSRTIAAVPAEARRRRTGHRLADACARLPRQLQRGARRQRPIPLQGASQGRKRGARALRSVLGQTLDVSVRPVPHRAGGRDAREPAAGQPGRGDHRTAALRFARAAEQPDAEGRPDADRALDVHRHGHDAARAAHRSPSRRCARR